MTRLWDRPGVPHKGWQFVHMEDLEEPIFKCEMCGQENIRYVHYMQHPDYSKVICVGCICAGHMEQDYDAPKEREKVLKSRAGRKARWCNRNWRTSRKGNPYLNANGYNIAIFRYMKSQWKGKYGFAINRRDDSEDPCFSEQGYDTVEEAKLASFDVFWELLHE